ncbi:RNA polymerase sigma factor [Streptomyces sp. NBC_00079]|uniref:RNA polymerase sigma factor n=1 Tax=Streptomyces sp. NBC_00079 TaxID=2975644 RepID=UPI00324FE4CF
MDDDDALIVAVAADDDAALRELFGRHAPWLASRLRRVLPADAVEDVLQETFLAVWRGAAGYRPQAKAGGWLWGIASRQAALWMRRHGRPPEPQAPAAEAVDPQERVLARMEIEEAVQALGEPGSAEREVWRLLYVEDRTVADVAQVMGIPPGTVKSRAFRVRRLLQAALGRAAT